MAAPTTSNEFLDLVRKSELLPPAQWGEWEYANDETASSAFLAKADALLHSFCIYTNENTVTNRTPAADN